MSRVKISGTYVRLEAVARHSWDEAVQALARYDDRSCGRDRRFLTLVRAGYHLCQSNSLEELLEAVLGDMVAVFQAQRGSIVLADEAAGHFQLRATASGKGCAQGERWFSRTLVERAYSGGQSLLCRDATSDAELVHNRSIQSGAMSSILCILLRSPRRRLGVLHLDRGPLQLPFTEDDFYLADAIAACVSTGIESAQLAELQKQQAMHTVAALAQAVELRDQYTGGHTHRVTTYSLMLADALRLSAAEHHKLQIGTPLHDIGKIGINDAILQKPGRLTDAEFEEMKLHTLKGAAIVEGIPSLVDLLPIVRNHHERWDGTGYPDRLASENISPLARVVAVADAFDAMTSERPYRSALPLDRAFGELDATSGSHFDPRCVRAFLGLRPQIEGLLARQCPGHAAPTRMTEMSGTSRSDGLLQPAGAV